MATRPTILIEEVMKKTNWPKMSELGLEEAGAETLQMARRAYAQFAIDVNNGMAETTVKMRMLTLTAFYMRAVGRTHGVSNDLRDRALAIMRRDDTETQAAIVAITQERLEATR